MCMALICLLPTRLAASGPARSPRSRSPHRQAAGTLCEPATPRRLSNADNASGNWRMSAAGSVICTTNAFMAWTPSSAASSASYAQRAAWQTPGSSSPPTMGNTSASMTASAMGRASTTSRLMFPSSSSLRSVPKGPALTMRRGSAVDGSRFPSHFVTCPGR